MCITMEPAKLSGTQLYAGEGRKDGKLVHVIAYQNTAECSGPNAMILPIPAAVMPDERNVIDTRPFALFLDDIHREPSSRGKDFYGSRSRPAQVFDVGSYTVVLAQSAEAISAALDRVGVDKRPADKPDLFAAFEELYPGWPLAVCCWNGTVKAEPLLWWYEPKDPSRLFAPALDAHDGGRPRLDEMVEVDHAIAFGARLGDIGRRVEYSAPLSGLAADLLPRSVYRAKLSGSMPNGDFWLSTDKLSGPAVREAPQSRRRRLIELNGF